MASGSPSSDRPVLPLYYRVYKTLEQRIQEERYQAAARLPSEDELCREFRVSRMTIRQAVGRLVENGLVVRRPGSGTYVRTRRQARAFRTIAFTGALEDLFAQVEKAQVTSVRIAEEPPPADVRHLMGVAEGEPVTVLRRVRAFWGDPFAFTINYVPRPLGRRIEPADLYRVPLLQIFEEKLGVRFTHAEQTVEAALATAEVAEALQVRFGDPVLFVERHMFAGQRTPEEVVRSYYRADAYRYKILLVRRRRARFAWAPGPD